MTMCKFVHFYIEKFNIQIQSFKEIILRSFIHLQNKQLRNIIYPRGTQYVLRRLTYIK